ncbi:hypothetical protein LP090_05260 [Moraxella bovis]|nr:hypothetical protein [Moraxella bovis]UZA43993.1 hypothetical protein LP090_05260 [Moraxella bovis]
MKTIILHGILAKKFGKSFKLAVGSTKEAMRALCVQLIGFEAFMMNAHRQGLRFAVFHDKQNVGESELEMTHTAKVIRVVPSTSEFISDKMFIAAISEVIDLKLRYPNTALLGLRYDAESFSNVAKMSARCKGLIIKVPTNYDPVARTYTGMWDGQFKMAYSNNPAWVYYDLCTAERYGLGGRLTQSMIDKWSLYRLAQYCDEMVDDGMGGQEPRFTVNVYIRRSQTTPTSQKSKCRQTAEVTSQRLAHLPIPPISTKSQAYKEI